MEDLKKELTTTQRDQKDILLQIAKKLKSGSPGNIVWSVNSATFFLVCEHTVGDIVGALHMCYR